MIRKFLLSLSLLLLACTAKQESGLNEKTITLSSPEGQTVTVNVDIADSNAERAQGLMYRESLPDGHGMLFVFDKEQPLNFWMKNTLIPLDILFFDTNGTLVSSQTMLPCADQDPCPVYPSGKPASYALEVPKGFIEQHGIQEEWKLETQK